LNVRGKRVEAQATISSGGLLITLIFRNFGAQGSNGLVRRKDRTPEDCGQRRDDRG
jgi:hypothetical protein